MELYLLHCTDRILFVKYFLSLNEFQKSISFNEKSIYSISEVPLSSTLGKIYEKVQVEG